MAWTHRAPWEGSRCPEDSKGRFPIECRVGSCAGQKRPLPETAAACASTPGSDVPRER